MVYDYTQLRERMRSCKVSIRLAAGRLNVKPMTLTSQILGYAPLPYRVQTALETMCNDAEKLFATNQTKREKDAYDFPA
jgi:hypothetical protein